MSVDTRPRIDLYSHHLTVTRMNDNVRRALASFLQGMIEWEFVRVPVAGGRPKLVRTPKRVYASATANRLESRHHIHQLDKIKAHLYANGIDPENGVEYVTHPLYEPERVTLTSKSGKSLYDNQVPVVDYFSANDGVRSKVATAPTGTGKSLMSMRSLVNLGVRSVFVIKAEYIDKWIEDLEKELDLGKGDLMVVRGSEQLISLMNLAEANELTAKIIIIGNRTFQNYLKCYERDPFFGEMYPVHPEQFYEHLKVGVRVIDEVHQDFHLNFKQDTYAHIPLTISLSATLDADQALLNDMYETMWPKPHCRAPEIVQERYIAATCMWYSAERPDRLRCTNAKRQYSHIEFEKSIMRNKQTLEHYTALCELIVRTKFVPNHEPGQKMLIFCSTIALCSHFQAHLQAILPDLKVARYVGEDDWEALHNNDIVVSTIQSAGTAVDIANLRYVLMTVALSNKQTNIQVLGRLRKLRDYPAVTPEFMFLACREIEKHGSYADAKKAKLDSKVKHFNQTFIPIRV